MADIISLIQDVCMDDTDEGVFEQGDCSSGSPQDDDALSPLSRVQKYAMSANVYDRQMVARIVQELFQTASVESLAKDIPGIMEIVRNLGEKDEAVVRSDLLEQIPHMASQALKHAERVEALGGVIGEYLLPLVVRNLGGVDNAVDKAAHTSLIHLMEQGLISKTQAEIQVCPAVLALANDEVNDESNLNTVNAMVTLMSKMAPLLGRDITERVFLTRFSQLCSNVMFYNFYTRKVCALHIGHFSVVVSKDKFESILLPCYLALCQDEIWGVRKSCAEVVMFISSVCSPEVRKTTLTPVFAKLLEDECRWVQMSAFQTLGPFIATFANPPLCSVSYNNQGDLVFVNNEGYEFTINSPSVPDDRFCKYLPKQPWMGRRNLTDEDKKMFDAPWDSVSQSCGETDLEKEAAAAIAEQVEDPLPPVTVVNQTDEDIKEFVETVKNAVLSFRTVETEHGVLGDSKKDLYNVIPSKNKSIRDKLDAASSSSADCSNASVTETVPSPEIKITPAEDDSLAPEGEISNDRIENQVNLSGSECDDEKEDDNLHLFNTFNYWYISPNNTPIDLSIIEDDFGGDFLPDWPSNTSNAEIEFEDIYCSLNDTFTLNSNEANYEDEESKAMQANQDIVPQVLISNYIRMTDSAFSITIDNDMAYHCAYSLPAVAMTLENKNWPLLKSTLLKLAANMQYKVRLTVASSLHELAVILGPEVASEHLTLIFEGFIKDLDEVRIGILKHLAYFLKIIKPQKRVEFLPRLHEFLNTEIEWNWRFRHELAQQLLLLVTQFRPVDAAKYIGLIAETLLHDVAEVRQVAISLISELLKHMASIPGLCSIFLVRLEEKFAHSKMWKRRQTFALLCYKLLQSETLPPEQFANELMPHLLDLSWDPVANVRLVVAKTIAQYIIPNEYFSDPDNQQSDSLGSVIRRLQFDKDRDVRHNAELVGTVKIVSPLPPSLDFTVE